MNITDAVYNQWVEDNQYELEPSNITKVYRKFQQELNRTTVMTSSRRDDLWEAMIECMTVVSEYSFKSGFRIGFQAIDEARK